MLSWEEFEKVDMRVGTIVKVNDFPEARVPAYQLEIDFGVMGIKKSSAQITKLYSKETLLGKQVIAVVNFSPKKIAHFYSEVLVLGVVQEEKDIILLQPERKAKNGRQIR